MPSVAAGGTQCLFGGEGVSSLHQKLRGVTRIVPRSYRWVEAREWIAHPADAPGRDSLAGRRLFFLSLDLLPDSCDVMESVWPTLVGESAMVAENRQVMAGVGDCR